MQTLPVQPFFQVHFSTFQDGLRAYVTGYNGSLECTLAYWRMIAVELRERRPAQLLVVDVMDGGVPPPEQLLDFVRLMVDEDLHELRIAYVEDKPDSIPKVELAGIFAHEHGFWVQIFDSEVAAMTWLRYGAT
ncbi:MAG: hypothetical protein LH491_01055 [Pseudoxanthomonas sp.]|nr:hypothetical protein [Pseudoxanthomonas sp.]